MSTLVIIIIVVLAYIMQVLLLLAHPYYKYRQNYKSHQQRTVGGLVKFTNCLVGEGYMFLVFFPFIGLAAFVLTLLIGLAVEGFKLLYNKHLKNLKI